MLMLFAFNKVSEFCSCTWIFCFYLLFVTTVIKLYRGEHKPVHCYSWCHN